MNLKLSDFTYKEGDRVILLADPEENLPEERGVVLGPDSFYDETTDEYSQEIYAVQIDKRYRQGRGDDGLRGGIPPETMKREA